MQAFFRFLLLISSPILMIIYWRNSVREIGDLHDFYSTSKSKYSLAWGSGFSE
jgi:hypothetical protein